MEGVGSIYALPRELNGVSLRCCSIKLWGPDDRAEKSKK